MEYKIADDTKVILRPATEADLPAMMELIRELAEYERAPEQVTVSPEDFRDAGFGVHPVWWALVAVSTGSEGNAIVGMALYYIRYSTWKGKRVYLEDLVVRQSWRGRGIGKMLMDRLLETAREQGYKGLSWQVLEWNDPAINFYKKYRAHFDKEWVNVSLEF